MGRKVYVLGAYSTPFSKWTELGFKALTRQAYMGALADGGLADGSRIDGAWFGNCLMSHWGQGMIAGNVCFIPLVREGLFPDRAPIINIEAGCSTGTLALHGAATAIRAGDADLAVAVGVEKLVDPGRQREIFERFSAGLDLLDPQEWHAEYTRLGKQIGFPFDPSPDRTVPMDTYAMQANHHMATYGTTVEQIAFGAAKNHCNGARNPNAHYRFEMTTRDVLADRPIVAPLTRAMCAPMTDGAAAVVLCSEGFLKSCSSTQRERAVMLRGIGLSGGKYRAVDEPSLTRTAAERAYKAAGIGPRDIDVAEVHDATAFCEIYQVEMMGFCAPGEGGAFVGSGETALGGSLPVNTSGGLVSKGHPIGATGLSMCCELVTQLRGEAGERQVEGATVGLQENGGGIIGLDEALAAVVIYDRNL